MNRSIIIAACLALAATVPAAAGNIYRQPVFASQAQPDAKSSAIKGGIVESNGTIAYGSGFTVSHPQTGVYEISFNAGAFKKCPLISVTAAGGQSVMPNLYYYSCGSGGVQITVEMENYYGGLEDNSFHFIAAAP